MMEQEAIVARVEGQVAIVELLSNKKGCGRCHEAGGCQGGLMNQLFSHKPRQYRLRNSVNAVVGERVIVVVSDATALRMALLAYFMPAALLIVGAWTGAILAGGDDTATALGAALGLALATLFARFAQSRYAATVEYPAIVRRSEGISFGKESCR